MKSHSAMVPLFGLVVLVAGACNGEPEHTIRSSPEPIAPSTLPLYPVVLPDKQDRLPAFAGNPIVIADCRLAVIDKQEVPSRREGVLAFIGTEIKPGEEVLPDSIITMQVGTVKKLYRRLAVGDPIEPGQLLAQLDDRLARDDHAMKIGKVKASRAELAAAEKTRDEAKSRYDTLLRLRGSGAVPPEELRGSRLTWERYVLECVSRKEAVGLAELERKQAKTMLDMHQIRSTIRGEAKAIYKRPGEAVRSLEPVLQIQRMDRLRIEGIVEIECLPRLRKGMRAVVEPSFPVGPTQSLHGHLQVITCVAVGKDQATILSGSEDGSVRVWDRRNRFERHILEHPAAVRCLACTLPDAPANWCLTGAADGAARIWDLDASSRVPIKVLKDGHRGPISSVAISPHGAFCATGSDDREICIWDTATGALRYRLPTAHRAVITSLQFTPQSQLVSASRDRTLRLWDLGSDQARLLRTFTGRSGNLAHPGVSADGSRLILDEGKALRLLKLPDCRTEAILENHAESSPFTGFAIFSPDGRLLLTTGPTDRLQLWRTSTSSTRPYELRRYVARDRSVATCAAFSPDGTFLVSGSKDRQVRIWKLPGRQEIEKQQVAEITLIDRAVEASDRHVRIWAEISNSDGRLLPGTSATLSIYPE